ncbi:Glycolate dehydrogenase, iron-sulfur subunit GlcF [Rhodovulum sp. PH10]|uniref:glycolate oxidase subunit GlcF n=1 Tax=Rhodovulum sp. PH10 TaxID=1187851 RepID=UPI00027C21FB|nr:glycolate oxidase subunit GlcF [Rhodovulum sp. PH10]EJW11435.1 Glycolate dehydrogenase, iron-sulfur subunit GlcF [Rhodovulum sp. PH10]
MRTEFSLAQLADPAIADADRILRACVHCGFCTATCPTYVLLGDELDSPRGRIYLIKDMLENDRPAAAEEVKHIDRCLSCLSCMTTCPAGVHYMHLVDHARVHVAETHTRPLRARFLRALLTRVIPSPTLFRMASAGAGFARPFVSLVERIFGRELAALVRMAPRKLAKPAPSGRRVFPAEGAPRGRIALLSGCVQRVMAPNINDAAIRVLTRHGFEVVLPAGEGCCGSVTHHMGDEARALAAARANVDAFLAEIDGAGLDAIAVTASGCGTTMKDYGHMLRTDPAYADKAARVAAKVRDISEVLYAIGPLKSVGRPPLVVAHHAPCSLQHGQKIVREPKEVLERSGFVVRDVPDGHLCCGSAGVYNVLQPELANQLRERKIVTIERIVPDVITAGNLGCITQIASGTTIPVVHPVELVDWATGGSAPLAMERRENG